MAKKFSPKKVPEVSADPYYAYADKEQVFEEVIQHYQWWNDDNLVRKTRKDGWDDITRAYYGRLPDDWPFISRVTDPRIRTTLLEKNARLTNKPLRGQVAPREGGDVIKAKINNAIVMYQWDAANNGGSMDSKISISDLDSRLYQSKFGHVYWRVEKNDEGETIFEGNEFQPWDINDCGMDPNSEGIKDAKWFQHRDWELLSDLEKNADIYPGFAELKRRLGDKKYEKPKQSRRDAKFLVEAKQIVGIEDHMGEDKAFPVIEKVVEFRHDKFIVFCPQYKLILAVMDQPYEHKQIPVAQLRYYPTTGDNLGESEVNSVLPLWRGIQAVLCGFLDEVILKMRPPLKGVEGAFRPETIIYAPTAVWLLDNINALAEVETRADSVRYFQTTYPALVSAFNSAMGDLSQGISNIDQTAQDKTATEIRQVSKQQNIRDQKNQIDLGQFIKDIVMMWISNNKQFLFKDQTKHEYVLRIIGQNNFDYFKRLGMDEMVLTDEGAKLIQETVTNLRDSGHDVSPEQMNTMIESVKIPKYPVATNPKAKKIEDMGIKPKLSTSEMGDSAELSIIPDDLDGLYDFIPDLKSTDMSQSEQMMFARTQAIQMVTNPNVLQLLAAEQVRPKLKEMLVSDFEDKGLYDAERFFEQINPAAGISPQGPQGPVNPTGGTIPTQQNPGMVNIPQAPTQPSIDQQMAKPNGL